MTKDWCTQCFAHQRSGHVWTLRDPSGFGSHVRCPLLRFGIHTRGGGGWRRIRVAFSPPCKVDCAARHQSDRM
eukprot:4316263-Pleurochrysis_carterae.AAC.2